MSKANQKIIKRATMIASAIVISMLTILMLVASLLHVGSASNVGNKLSSSFSYTLGVSLGLPWFDKLDKYIQWIIILGSSVLVLLILALIIVILAKSSAKKRGAGDSSNFRPASMANGQEGGYGNTQMFLTQGKGAGYGYNGLDAGYMPPDGGQMLLGQTVKGNPYMRGIPSDNLAAMSLNDILGFDMKSPLVTNNKLEGRAKTQQETKTLEQRLKKAEEDYSRLKSLYDSNSKQMESSQEDLAALDNELQGLIDYIQDAPKKRKSIA